MTKLGCPINIPRLIKQGLLAFSCGLLLSLGGCSVLGPVKTPPASNYTLSAADTAKSKPGGSGRPTLLVATPVASAGYDTNDMVYMDRAYQLKHYANNHWVSPPAELLTPILEQKLHNSGCFRAVVAPPFSGNTDLTLNTQLQVLRQEFTYNRSQVRLVLAATLVDSATQHIVAQRRFEALVPTYQSNPYSGVIGANQATAAVMNKLSTFLCHYAGYRGPQLLPAT